MHCSSLGREEELQDAVSQPAPRSAPAGVGSPTKRLPGSRPITGWRKLQLVCRMIPGPSNAADSTIRLNVNLVLA